MRNSLMLRGFWIVSCVVRDVIYVKSRIVKVEQSMKRTREKELRRLRDEKEEKEVNEDSLERAILIMGIWLLYLSLTIFRYELLLGPCILLIGWFLLFVWVSIPSFRRKEAEE